MNNLGNYSSYLSPQYQNSFFSKLEFLFSVLGSMVSKNICKLRHKLKNSKNVPELTWSWQNKPWFRNKQCVFLQSFYRQSWSLSDQSETTIAKQFFLNFNYCFLFLVWYCLETCVNCVPNCVTQKFTPLRSQFYKLFFSMSFHGQFRKLFHISEPKLLKQFFLNLNFCFLF